MPSASSSPGWPSAGSEAVSSPVSPAPTTATAPPGAIDLADRMPAQVCCALVTRPADRSNSSAVTGSSACPLRSTSMNRPITASAVRSPGTGRAYVLVAWT
ncbi:hypothetical protein [Streptomyces monashensis]|uniref:hypothetical protein n=1 Tax=Streptomyces monashensis TaxID=1678012 RepID=UPI001160B179|nr:hypothetical protein [Streptomyces monashensis]